jgi:repressor LexA
VFELNELHEQQRAVLNLLSERELQREPAPTYREMADELGLKTPSASHHHVRKLIEKGMVNIISGIARGIQLTDRARYYLGMLSEASGQAVSIPIKGLIGASQPLEYGHESFDSFDEDDVIAVDPQFLQHTSTDKLYALRVSGNSMIDAMIADGDIVVMGPCDNISDGDMVAVWLMSDSTMTLKHIFREKGRIRLQPANPTMDPIYVENQEIVVQGRVLSIIRTHSTRQFRP